MWWAESAPLVEIGLTDLSKFEVVRPASPVPAVLKLHTTYLCPRPGVLDIADLL